MTAAYPLIRPHAMRRLRSPAVSYWRELQRSNSREKLQSARKNYKKFPPESIRNFLERQCGNEVRENCKNRDGALSPISFQSSFPLPCPFRNPESDSPGMGAWLPRPSSRAYGGGVGAEPPCRPHRRDRLECCGLAGDGGTGAWAGGCAVIAATRNATLTADRHRHRPTPNTDTHTPHSTPPTPLPALYAPTPPPLIPYISSTRARVAHTMPALTDEQSSCAPGFHQVALSIYLTIA